jgi:serine-type D-Ala-D-Ala carboxypeptidase/endopeptidase (penicillin-binding protein 4)
LAVPHVSRARTGAVAFDLQTGQTVFAEHDAVSLVPASNEKLAVTYAALTGLGAAYRIETDVLGRGQQSGTVWRGSLLLVGHGDPTLSSADLALLARHVRAVGIVRVTGAVFGDESFFDSRRTAAGWKSWYYINESPPLSALTVDRSRYHGGVSRNPALAAALAFRDALRRAGVAVGGAGVGVEHGDEVPLAAVDSPPLSEIVRYMDRASDNFTAELLLKQLGAIEGRAGTSAAGAAYVRTALAEAGVPLAGVRIVDGSGLSLLDRLTPRAIAGILRAAWADDGMRPVLLAALPVAGISGTLRDRMRTAPARGNVRAKTGTTGVASALSGYVRRRYVFSVVQNGQPISTVWARKAQDRFATALAAQQ